MTEPVKTTWRWGCLPCMETGPADSAEHAASLERVHRFFACPHAPGLDADEKRRRQVWARVRRERYEIGRHPQSAGAALHPAGEARPTGGPTAAPVRRPATEGP